MGLLFYAATEPLTHYSFLSGLRLQSAPRAALTVTNFDWGIHVWPLYGITALVIAYLCYRKDQQEMLKPTMSLKAQKVDDRCALTTDGRYSGPPPASQSVTSHWKPLTAARWPWCRTATP